MYLLSSGVLASAVAVGGTVAITLPNGFDAGRAAGGLDHRFELNQSNLVAPVDFSVALAGTTATITNKTAAAWPAGSPFTLQLNQVGDAAKKLATASFNPMRVDGGVHLVNIGGPAAGTATGVMAATAVASANVNLLAATVAVLGGPCGRALNVVSSNSGDTTQTVTVTGTDGFGLAQTQTFTMNGTTTVVGTKAFATVTSVTSSAALTGNLSVGTTNVFGLPDPLNMLGLVVKDLTDGAVSGTAGTFVVADTTAGGPTGATGDIRGTYTPNTTPNGTHYYHVVVLAPDFRYPGAQIAPTHG